MKKFIKENFIIIVFIFLVFIFFKSCNDTREIIKIKSEISQLRDSITTKVEYRNLSNNVDDLKNTVYGFMDSQNFILNNFIDLSIQNKSTRDAWNLYSNKIKELNKEKNEKLDK